LERILKTFAKVNPVITRTATIFVDENDIINITMHKNVHVDYEDVLDNLLVIRNLSGNKRVLKLIDSRLNWTIDKKAKKYIETSDVKNKTLARAVLKGSVLNKLVSNLFMNLNEPQIPTKVFTNLDEAYNWLLKFKSEP
jgi:hypothetical protein